VVGEIGGTGGDGTRDGDGDRVSVIMGGENERDEDYIDGEIDDCIKDADEEIDERASFWGSFLNWVFRSGHVD